MKNLSFPPSRRGDHARRERGAALVLVLACVAILSTLVLAFLLYSQLQVEVSAASASQTGADLFARGAVDAVIGDLKQEITAGSTNGTFIAPSGSDVRSPYTLFMPVTNYTVVPYHMTNAAGIPGSPPPNVVKWSAYGQPFYANTNGNTWYDITDWPAPDDAADDSSTNPSDNNRVVSTTNWNLPLFMAPVPDGTETNLTPPDNFSPPDWIYLNRSAAPVTVWTNTVIPDLIGGAFNTNRVVGRYAYVVYDEGGLLDANAAGYPSSVTTTMVRHKISEACADLTQIGLESSDINALVQWRNPVNGTSATAYSNYIYGYSNNVYSPSTNAFLSPAPGEQLFTSRQQLINFLVQDVAGGNAADVERVQAALPYLTTFSRELNQPSWYPTENATAWGGSSAYAYATLSTNVAAATNVFVPLAQATSTLPADLTNGLVVAPNEPVAFARFPLSRLSWLGANGPNGATAAQIQQSFGLVWDSGYAAWIYAGPSGSSALSSVDTLLQVADAGRVPNFFELLKAGILAGSLGMYPAPDSVSANQIDSRYTGTTTVSPVDLHVMQVGLGIIDQSNANPLPARIEFGTNTGASALYGSKSLPYLYQLAFSPYRPVALDQNTFEGWLEPIFWDPYETETASSSSLALRVRQAQGELNAGTTYATNGSVYYTTPPLDGTTTTNYLEVSAANGGNLINTTTTPTLLSALATNSNYTVTYNNANDLFTESSTGTTYLGFFLGEVFAPNPPNPDAPIYNGAPAPNIASFPNFSTTNQFVVEANYSSTSSSNWQEVERMNIAPNDGMWETDTAHYFTQPQFRYSLHFEDPRTGRFGFNNMGDIPPGYTHATVTSLILANAATWTTFWSSTQNFSNDIAYLPNSRSGAGAMSFNYGSTAYDTAGSPYRLADNGSTVANVSSPAYTDSDGAQRRADGWWSSETANTLPMRGDTTAYRPVFLGRPYESVGELGYVFRDLPWRSLDFCNTNSADGGLLDLFCVNDGYAGNTNAPMVAGRVDLNTENPPVRAALLSGAARAELNTSYDIDSSDAQAIATNIVDYTSTNGPLRNKAEIATRLAQVDPTVYPNATAEPQIDTNTKERREALVRALAEAGQVRTWNLMIDVVAQTGYFPPTATALTSSQFVVNSQRRYWAHVALDRYTGQVIDMQIEPVGQ